MLRTNQSFLDYFERLYKAQEYKEAILLKSFSAGQLLLSQGSHPSRLFLIKMGIVKCFIQEENEKEYILEFLSTGEIVGDIERIKNMACLCSIQAIGPVQAYSITVSLFDTLFKNDLAFNRLLVDLFALRVINTSKRASFQQLHPLEESLSQLLELQNGQQVPISKEDMAAYLGVTIRSLNRALKNLKKA